jgi:hypothetical protein
MDSFLKEDFLKCQDNCGIFCRPPEVNLTEITWEGGGDGQGRILILSHLSGGRDKVEFFKVDKRF